MKAIKTIKLHTCGGGEPDAEHFNDICGPGRTFCSINVYINSGVVSEINNNNVQKGQLEDERLSS